MHIMSHLLLYFGLLDKLVYNLHRLQDYKLEGEDLGNLGTSDNCCYTHTVAVDHHNTNTIHHNMQLFLF
jgi:hypothetical protein